MGSHSITEEITIPVFSVSDEMISAAAQILEAANPAEMSQTIAEVVAQEMLLAALAKEHDRLKNKAFCT